MIIGVSAMMADILTMAQASGVDPQSAVKLLGMLDLNAVVAGRGANMAKGNFAATFELTMARMDQLIAKGHGALDASAGH